MIKNLTSNFEKIYSREEKRREEKEEKRRKRREGREELNYALLLARSKLLRSVIPYG